MTRYLSCCFVILSLPTLTFADIFSANEALSRGDYETAAREFRQLADAGDARAQSNLGYMYYVGEGLPQSYEQAVEWYRKAAIQGDKDAQYNLAVAYAFGEGTKQDYNEAAVWYRRAAEQGHLLAQYSLGISYSFGEGVKQDSTEAVNWFRMAADQGYERAQVQLGSKYHTGDGVTQDYEQAVFWYRKAADRGNAAAQYNLGTLYRSGRGVEQDYNQAVRWFRLAADQGYAAAQNELASIERAIAGAARSNTTPSLRPSPITRPEPVVQQAVVTEAPPPATTVRTSEPEPVVAATAEPAPEQPRRGFFGRLFGRDEEETPTDAAANYEEQIEQQPQARTPLFSVDSEDLLSLDEPAAEPEAAPSPEPELLSMEETATADASGPQPLDAEELLATGESRPAGEPATAIDNEDTSTVPAVDTERPRGFFSRLFNRGDRAATAAADAESADATPVAEVEENEEAGVIEPATVEDEPRRGLFGRLFGARKDSTTDTGDDATPEPAAEATPEYETAEATLVAEEELSSTQAYETTEDDIVAESDEQPLAEEISEVTEDQAGAEPRRGFFGRLFGGRTEDQDETVAETPTDMETESIAVEQEETVAEIEQLEPDAETEDEPKRGGFFRNIFRRQSSTPEPEPVAIDDSSVVIAQEPENVMDIDDEPESYEEAITGPEDDSQPEDAVMQEEQPRRGFFSNLFNRGRDSGTGDEEASSATTEADVTVGSSDRLSDPQEYQAALDAFNNKEYEEAYLLFRSMAVAGDHRAQYQLGSIYHQGLGIRQNYTDAMYWYQQAAEQGNVDAQYSLANMYLMGEGITQDDTQAVYWYEKAAAQGHEPARHNLANLKKVVSGTSDNVGEIVPGEVAEDAEDNQQPETEKKSRFGFIKNIFSKDKKEVEETVEQAEVASQPEPEPEPEATDEPKAEKKGLFSRLFNRNKEEADETETPTVHEEMTEPVEEPAAEETAVAARPSIDQAKSSYERGLDYQYGEGVTQDSAAAFQLFMQSARQGYAPAQYKIGAAYAYGEGVARDNSEAARWYNMAARQGYAIAQRNLGVMYLNGDGVDLNKPMALAWYSVLADGGNVMDVRRRDMLENELSVLEQQEARRIKEGLLSEIHADN